MGMRTYVFSMRSHEWNMSFLQVFLLTETSFKLKIHKIGP